MKLTGIANIGEDNYQSRESDCVKKSVTPLIL